ncbi:MAG: DUF84 family protein [Kurthia sp.]|nr:DUF84 family protein [Candidatus Kurthia equi]
MNIAVGSKNKAKLLAVETVVQRVLMQQFTIEGLDVASNVSEQPFSDEETRQGAMNRAVAVREASGAEIGFGLEGGVKWLGTELYLCNWAALASEQGIYTAAGAQIPLPKEIAHALLRGEELGPIMDRYTNEKNIRQHAGAIGVFTDGLISRAQMFEPIIEMLVGQYRYWAKQQSCKE